LGISAGAENVAMKNKMNETLIEISELVKQTNRPEVLSDIGSFGGLFALRNYDNPVLVASTDGVGTKLKVATMLGKHDTVGYDLVTHCGNDIAVQGAEPLFFLDYFGTSKLNHEVLLEVIRGMVEGCREIGASLIGGETAEMSGFYNDDEYDLVGTIVGVVEQDQLITGENIRPGDVILGVPSLGLHTNGYTLAREIFFDKCGYSPDDYIEVLGCTVGEELLKNHRSYVDIIDYIKSYRPIHGLAHITGGGIAGNLVRILPDNCSAVINKKLLPTLPIFPFLKTKGGLSESEMFDTFNMGVGLVIVVNPDSSKFILNRFKHVKKIGEIKDNRIGVVIK
tara:strand:+ start:744 stop:1757 length:1014 start_codon:yes stop_codon:yes gene_type:complete